MLWRLLETILAVHVSRFAPGRRNIFHAVALEYFDHIARDADNLKGPILQGGESSNVHVVFAYKNIMHAGL